MSRRDALLFVAVGLLLVGVGFFQSWNVALAILNMGLVSAIMTLGVNIQWGYAGLFNVGVTGFVALGGLAIVVISVAPVGDAWAAGGLRVVAGLLLGVATILGAIAAWVKFPSGRVRAYALAAIMVIGFFLYRWVFDPAVAAIEAVTPASTGFLGGAGLPVLLGWPVGALLAAGAAFVIGKIALGLRSEYLAIATLGIAEIIVAILKNEEWLTRGVKNVVGLPRPVPYEVELQQNEGFSEVVDSFGLSIIESSSILVKLCYASIFLVVLLGLLWLSQRALSSPWGRMMRAIRDNETAAEAMGKDVTGRHLQVFVLGSAVCGLAGAMMTTLDGQFTPTAYQPLRFTFLIWVMVIVGGSGNNFGSVLGGILIWFCWIEVEPLGIFLLDLVTSWMSEENPVRAHLLESAAHMRLLTMGLILLLVMRFYPRGLIPER